MEVGIDERINTLMEKQLEAQRRQEEIEDEARESGMYDLYEVDLDGYDPPASVETMIAELVAWGYVGRMRAKREEFDG